MKLILCSHSFQPAVGGIETSSKLLAENLAALGVQVSVCTQTPSGPVNADGYDIWRRPTLWQLLKLGRQCDAILQNNISLRTLLPLLVVRKPIVIVHHTWIRGANGKIRWQDKMKFALARRFKNVCVSEALRSALPFPSDVVMNPVELRLFDSFRNLKKKRDIVFVGRLVSDKGCDLLLRALAQLRERGSVFGLTVLGDGPELSRLERLSDHLGITDQVKFAGKVVMGRGRIIAEHKVIAIPSRWAEPFGIVAIEGLAAGCVPVAARIGGLPEAISEFGDLVDPDCVDSLARGLQTALDPTFAAALNSSALAAHLGKFDPAAVARRYLEIVTNVVQSRQSRSS